MPFDPHILHPDEEARRLDAAREPADLGDELPPELADLATKLQADAAWLSDIYSAGRMAPQAEAAQAGDTAPFSQRWRTVALSSAAALLLILLGSAAWRFSLHQPRVTTPAESLVSSAVASERDADVLSATLDSADPLPASPTNTLLQGATGPELEGLLDLMEDDALTGSVVSL